MRFLISLLVLLVLTPGVNAESLNYNAIAEVVKIRGEVSQLSPGSLSGRKVILGDKFIEDTSIVTGVKSFIKIKLIDNSEINVGPESKIVISEMKKNSIGIISLLKGRIRSEVQKNNKDKISNKFFVKTRTAAMGVRGTEFQTIYNPENNVTSLLTFKGEVAMAKIDDRSYQKIESISEQKIVRDELTKGPQIQNVPGEKNNEIQQLNLILKNKSTVIVPAGQTSISVANFKKATLPVQISSLQLEAIYKNKDFVEKAPSNIVLQSALETLKSTSTVRTLTVAKQAAPAEGLFNEVTGDFAPKSGGFIDSNTGLYIAPVNDVAKMGGIDADTGQYVAPKGLVLDAKKGFILAAEGDKNSPKEPELLVLRENLNKNIARDTILASPAIAEELEFKINEKFIHERIVVSFFSMSQTLTANEKSTADPYLKLASSHAFRLSIDWLMASSNRFSPLVSLDYSVVNYRDKETKSANLDSQNLVGLSYGFQFALSKIFNVYSKLGLYQDHYLDQLTVVTSNTYHLQKIVITRLTAGISAELWQKNKISLDANANLFFTFHKRINNILINRGNGYQLELLPKYSLSDNKWIGLGMKKEGQGQKTYGRVGANDLKRENSGLQLKYLSDF